MTLTLTHSCLLYIIITMPDILHVFVTCYITLNYVMLLYLIQYYTSLILVNLSTATSYSLLNLNGFNRNLICQYYSKQQCQCRNNSNEYIFYVIIHDSLLLIDIVN